uniref:C-type lectin domain-containing protein n=1 Tax=Amphiprion percula TaxID=161767 RepID=A0A3P8THI4_AMPPE
PCRTGAYKVVVLLMFITLQCQCLTQSTNSIKRPDKSYHATRYSFIDIPLNWYEAQRFCRVKFTDLVTINNMYNNNKLLDALGGQVSLTWIGLHRGASDRWMWADGGGEALFTRWTEGEPNQLAADEWCAEASSSGRWNDVSCAEKKDFICYDRE